MKFSVFQISRKGGREKNEDRMGYSYTRESAMFALADGMGGHPEGEVAAQLALQTFSALFQNEARPLIDDVPAFLERALMSAHQQIVRYASQKDMLDSPRTTLVAAIVQRGAVTWIHCGDSRLYFMRGGQLLARTRDHSYAEQKIAANLKPERFNRHVLFTCLGSPSQPIFDICQPQTLQQGDRIMLCSDGLWGSVDDDAIVKVMCNGAVDVTVPEAVELAMRQSGEHGDNVTVLAMQWETPNAIGSGQEVSTDSISNGVFASTIQAGMLDSFVDDLDDAAIERSIAEINDAIRKTAQKTHRSSLVKIF
jgi:PPM family protein phosphatase